MPGLTPKPENLAQLVFFIRGERVMLDADLALLYGVPTGALNRAVQRNIARFPSDFMFRLTADDWEDLKRQIGISSSSDRPTSQRVMRSQIVTASTHGGRRGLPYAFTEQGVAMLSSVLHSKRAIQVNIQIMRVFTRLRQMLLGTADLKRELEEMKRVTDDRS